MTEPTRPTASGSDLPPRDHNQPPEVLPYDVAKLNAAQKQVDQFVTVSDEWKPIDINNEDIAGQLNDQINGLAKLKGRVEATRTAQKEPHITAGKAVDAAFNPLKERLEKAINALKPKLTVYAQKKAADEAARKQAAKEAADRMAADARRLEMDAANSGRIADEAAAEEAKKRAEAAQKSAAKPQSTAIKSGSGGGRSMALRSRRVVEEVKSYNLLFRRYQEEPKVQELLKALATAEANAAGFTDDDTIPGVTLGKTQSLA